MGLVLIDHAGLPLTGGFIGVDVFFVISGFLITGLLVRELNTTGTVSMAGFYARRARRLLPGAALVLVVTGVLTLLVLPRTRWLSTGFDVVASALYVQNWRLADLAVDYSAQDGAASPLQHFWSLAVEEQFYFLWPALLLAVTATARARPRSGRAGLLAGRHPSGGRPLERPLLAGLALVALPSLAYSVVSTAGSPQRAYFITTTRLWELAVGGGIAILAPRLLRAPRVLAATAGWAGLVAIVLSAVTYTAATPFPGSAAALPVLGAAAVIAGGPAAGSSGPVVVLGLAPMRWVGRLSYSLYLWHWPLLVVATAALGVLSATAGAVVVVLSLVPAYLAFRFVEEPVRHGRGRVLDADPGRTLFLGGAFSAVSVAVGFALVFALWPPPPPLADPAIAAALSAVGSSTQSVGEPTGAQVLGPDPRDDPAGAPVDSVASINPSPLQAKTDTGRQCTLAIDERVVRTCVSGDTRSGTNVALVGDSHAAQWDGPLGIVARQHGWRLTSYTKANCPFSTQDVAFVKDEGADTGATGVARVYDECNSWRDEVRDTLLADPPAMLVVSNVERQAAVDGVVQGPSQSKPLLVSGLEQMWRSFLDKGTAVVVVADTPRPQIDVPSCVSDNPEQLTRCTFDRDEGNRARSTSLSDAAAATPGTTFVDLSDAICPTQRCAPVIGDVLLYRDTNHLTNTYAATLAPRLDTLLPAIDR